MIQKKKGLQIGGFIVGAAALALVVFSFSSDQATTAEELSNGQTGTIVVNSVGEVKVEPDMAYVHLGAQALADSAEKAQKQVGERMTAVRNVLSEHGIQEEDIQTARFNVYPEHQYSPNGETTNERYRAQHILRIEYREIATLGELIDAAAAAGANQIEHTQFALENPEAAEHEAMKQAIEKTRAKADVMAESVGKARGEVLQISDRAAQVHFPTQDFSGGREESADSSSASTIIEAGEVQITQSVDVVYRLQ
ncbi:SIMPL domain-containing protein [Alkalihalobacillus oceani]|uniref:SIMPL domain-containing protein n=1 Tax=Halalkalibacter oceani TaxID=1653776 RepID=A0A9X2DMV4_9BACI|nr:SIMPL domain-containing protein [Halalkalibacter oceani]MCM3713754.1 SIMPL domain-containing protein [Halalkalibacter oceani]